MKKIIRLTESDLTKIVRQVIMEQSTLTNLGRVGFDITKPNSPSGKMPRHLDDPSGDMCTRSFKEAIKAFHENAFYDWKGPVDEKYMNSLYQKITSAYKNNATQFLISLDKINTRSGMGWFIRKWNKDKGKNFFYTMKDDWSISWGGLYKILNKPQFGLSLNVPGCGNNPML